VMTVLGPPCPFVRAGVGVADFADARRSDHAPPFGGYATAKPATDSAKQLARHWTVVARGADMRRPLSEDAGGRIAREESSAG
jgi:hypothetical protein